MMHEEFQQARNELLQREDVQFVLESIFMIIRDDKETLADRVHREKRLTKDQIDYLVELADQNLVELEEAIKRFFNERPIGPNKSNNLFGLN